MISVLINGCNGNMGKELIIYIISFVNFYTLCGFDRIDIGNNNFRVL